MKQRRRKVGKQKVGWRNFEFRNEHLNKQEGIDFRAICNILDAKNECNLLCRTHTYCSHQSVNKTVQLKRETTLKLRVLKCAALSRYRFRIFRRWCFAPKFWDEKTHSGESVNSSLPGYSWSVSTFLVRNDHRNPTWRRYTGFFDDFVQLISDYSSVSQWILTKSLMMEQLIS